MRVGGKVTSGVMMRWVTLAALAALVVPWQVVFLREAVTGLARNWNRAQEVFSWSLLARSLSMAGASALAAGALGGFCGTAAGRLSRRARVFALFVFVMPLACPPSVHAYVWRNVALECGLLGDLFVEGGSRLVNYAGAVFSTVSALWAIPALAAFAVSAGAGKRYEMEARPFAAAGTAARHILAPAVLPAALAAAGFAFILAVGEYSIPALWQIDTYPTRVLMLYSAYFEPQLAAAASIAPLVVTAAAAVAVFASASKALSQSDVERAQADESVLWRPGRASGSVLVATCCLFVGVPLAASAYWTVSDWTGFGALGAVGEDFLHTFFVAGLAALCAAIAGVLVPALWWADGRRAARGALWLCVAAFLMPATGAALAVKALVQWDMVPAFVGDSTLTLSYALAGRYAAIPLVLAVLALSRIDRQFIHLARVCGVARSPRLIVAFAPVILGAGVAGGIVALVLGVSELPMSMILAPAGRPPVAVDLFNLMHYARQGQAFAAAIMMMVGASAAVLAAFSMAAGTWKRYLSAA